MHKNFAAHFPLAEAEIKEVWQTGTVVLDTNALLDCYRLSKKTVDEMFLVLDKVADRLFLPHQVAVEFFRHRESVIAEQVRAFETVRNTLRSLPNVLLKAVPRHPAIPVEEISSEIAKVAEQQLNRVSAQDIPNINYIESGKDPVLEKLSSLFADERCGVANSAHDAIIDQRFADNIPPCYYPENKSKPSSNTHWGDGKVWLEVMDQAGSTKLPVLLVTSDKNKGNWWRTATLGNEAKEIGPQFQLINDIYQLHGKHLLMYTLADFLKSAQLYVQIAVGNTTIQEVEDVEATRNQNQSLSDLESSSISEIRLLLMRFILRLDQMVDQLRESPDKAVTVKSNKFRRSVTLLRHLARELRFLKGAPIGLRSAIGRATTTVEAVTRPENRAFIDVCVSRQLESLSKIRHTLRSYLSHYELAGDQSSGVT